MNITKHIERGIKKRLERIIGDGNVTILRNSKRLKRDGIKETEREKENVQGDTK